MVSKIFSGVASRSGELISKLGTNIGTKIADKSTKMSNKYVEQRPFLKEGLGIVNTFSKTPLGSFLKSPPKYIAENYAPEFTPAYDGVKMVGTTAVGLGVPIYSLNQLYKNRNDPTGMINKTINEPLRKAINSKSNELYNNTSHLEESYNTIKDQSNFGGRKTKRRKTKKSKKTRKTKKTKKTKRTRKSR